MLDGLERFVRGLELFEEGKVETYSPYESNRQWSVFSGDEIKHVQVNKYGKWECTCMDNQNRNVLCKHQIAVLCYLYSHAKVPRNPFMDIDIPKGIIKNNTDDKNLEEIENDVIGLSNVLKDFVDNNTKKERIILLMLKIIGEITKIRI